MIDAEFLLEFERSLNPAKRESKYPMKILGYGEISVVFEVEGYDYALKRIPNFKSEEEVRGYVELFHRYESMLRDAGLTLPKSTAEYVLRDDGVAVLYIIQEKLRSSSICNKLIHELEREELDDLFLRILGELNKVWEYNSGNDVEIGIDGQVSNWALENDRLFYFDTGTPMVRERGVHLINTEVFLRAAPPVMRTIVKWLFLQEILDRYFDFRLVVLDLLANLIKEKKSDVIPRFADLANDFFRDKGYDFELLSFEEIKKYYDRDASIWELYLKLRKFHRSVLSLFKRRYEYFLPEKIER